MGEQVTVWRRSYDIPPPDSDKSSEHWPGNDPKYAKLDKHVMPTTESLATTAARVVPYWHMLSFPSSSRGKMCSLRPTATPSAHWCSTSTASRTTRSRS